MKKTFEIKTIEDWKAFLKATRNGKVKENEYMKIRKKVPMWITTLGHFCDSDANPIEHTNSNWLVVDGENLFKENVITDNSNKQYYDEDAGKWLIFCQGEYLDKVWKNIRQLYIDKRLSGSAKCSTKKSNASYHGANTKNEWVIVLYCNWKEELEYNKRC